MWRGSGWSCRALCAVLCVLGAGQVVSSLSADPPGCQPGFSSAEYTFTVKRRQLERGRKLGKVSFTDCTTWKNGMFDVGDSRFHVTPDGTVKVKHHVKLHTDVKFTISSWDVGGHKFSAVVTVNTRHRLAKESRNGPSELPVLLFPEKRTGLHRRKRDWVIPPIRVPENERGPFPKHLVQIKSNKDQGTKVLYSITGQGADSHPEGVFGIERATGWMTVTRPLDREQYSKYVLLSHAVSENGQPVEDPMEIIISVIDQNDNRPAFTQDVFKGFVREGVQPGTPVMNVTATDDDDAVETFNAVLGYSILKQEPDEPTAGLFTINRNTGLISVIGAGLDRERIPKYTLIVEAADMDGTGLTTTATAIIEIVDANDNAPIFDPKTYTVTVPENRGDFEVQRLSVTDLDQAGTPAWLAVYKISGLNSLNNSFSITTDPETNDGILITAKGLDFETKKQYVLQITVENVDPFTVQLPTSTATVTVNVEDVNEAPYFEPTISRVSVLEDLPLGQKVVSLIAQDPDKQQIQKLSFSIGNDPAGWLTVNPNTGIVTGNGNLDRESAYVKNNTYTVIMLVTDDGFPPGTGTGTIILNVLDVNDNGPVPSPRTFSICNQDPEPQVLSVHDDDLPPNTYPFTVELLYGSESMWMVDLKDEGKTMLLTPIEDIKVGDYNLYIRLSDAQLRQQLTVVNATVCDCTGSTVHCSGFVAAGVNLPIILVILGSILALLILILLLLLFLKRRKVVKEPLLLPEDDTRDNILNYSEEAGEEDQDFDLAQLHRGLDARPDVIRNDVAPVSMPGPQYRPRPSNPQEIGNFINENLDAADNDPTAPPYDSLLVFDYEGSGSEAASLSSLNSSSDGDYDYNYLGEWGPRFKKLADLYGDDDDDE